MASFKLPEMLIVALSPSHSIAGEKVKVGASGSEHGATQVTLAVKSDGVIPKALLLSNAQFERSLIVALKKVDVPVKVPVYMALSSSVPTTLNNATQLVPFVNPTGSSDRAVPSGVKAAEFQKEAGSSVIGVPFPSSP